VHLLQLEGGVCWSWSRRLTIRSSRPHVVASATCFCATLARVRRPATGRLNSGVRPRTHSQMTATFSTLDSATTWFKAQGFKTSYSNTGSVKTLSVFASQLPSTSCGIDVFRHVVTISPDSGEWIVGFNGAGQLVEEVRHTLLSDAVAMATRILSRKVGDS
jgi:hypothetical protein